MSLTPLILLAFAAASLAAGEPAAPQPPARDAAACGSPLAKYDPDRELRLGETKPEEPDRPLRRFLYLNTQDSSEDCRTKGIVVLDLDNHFCFVKRLGSRLMRSGPSTINSLTGVRWQSGSAVLDRLYYSYNLGSSDGLRRWLDSSVKIPEGYFFLLGCVDLRTDQTLWEIPVRVGSVAVTEDGHHLLGNGMCGISGKGYLYIMDPLTGQEQRQIQLPGTIWFYPRMRRSGTIVSWPAIPLNTPHGLGHLCFDLEQQVVMTIRQYLERRGFPKQLLDTIPAPRHSYDFTSDGKESFCLISERAGAPNVAIHLNKQQIDVLPSPIAMKRQSRHPHASDGKLPPDGACGGFQLHPSERFAYVGCSAGSFYRVQVFDLAEWAPLLVGYMGVDLYGYPTVDPVSGMTVGKGNKGYAFVCGDGQFVWNDSWVFCTKTWKPICLLRDDTGKPIRCTKANEVHFRGKDVVYVRQRYNEGCYTCPEKVFPPSIDKTPPTRIGHLVTSPDDPYTCWADGAVVADVVITWSPASDNEGVQRYAVWRNGELIGNCLGVNPALDPVMSAEDQAVYEQQAGKFTPNTFKARYLAPGKTYKFEVEPIDFAQNRGPRTAIEVAVPAVPDEKLLELVKARIEQIATRAEANKNNKNIRNPCVEAILALLDTHKPALPEVLAVLDRLAPLGEGDTPDNKAIKAMINKAMINAKRKQVQEDKP